jgi:hypothetical protein
MYDTCNQTLFTNHELEMMHPDQANRFRYSTNTREKRAGGSFWRQLKIITCAPKKMVLYPCPSVLLPKFPTPLQQQCLNTVLRPSHFACRYIATKADPGNEPLPGPFVGDSEDEAEEEEEDDEPYVLRASQAGQSQVDSEMTDG